MFQKDLFFTNKLGDATRSPLTFLEKELSSRRKFYTILECHLLMPFFLCSGVSVQSIFNGRELSSLRRLDIRGCDASLLRHLSFGDVYEYEIPFLLS